MIVPERPTAEQKKVIEFIQHMPNNGEWWHTDSQDTFNEVGLALLWQGHTVDEVTDILESLYGATANEFGM